MTARLLVNLAALTANYRRLCAGAESTAAVVKANAYGCGLGPVAQALHSAGCSDFFVANCSEAQTLRALLPKVRIFVFEGPLPHTAALLAELQAIPVVNDLAQLQTWSAYRQLPIAAHVDTGMARLGFAPADLQPQAFAGYALKLLLTHLACADDPQHPTNQLQLQRFAEVSARFPEIPVSVGNSAATLSAALPTLGLARPGIALYGGAPFAHTVAPLQVVASLQGQVLQVRELAAGETLGYGGTWSATRPSRIAVVGLGYADGLSRRLSNCGQAVVSATRVPIVGRISMDLVQLDVTDVAAQPGDWAEFFGEQLPLAQLSALLQTIDYELLVSVGPRVQRHYRGEAGD